MEKYAVKMQKKLRRGYTTGSCAAAGAYAAVTALLTGESPSRVKIRLPNEEEVTIFVQEAFTALPFLTKELRAGAVSFYVIKDAGDDPDVTHGMRVYVSALRMRSGEVELAHAFRDGRLWLTGGVGVGRVTKTGLEQDVGQAAINKVPRAMIFEAARAAMQRSERKLSDGEELLLIVSVPDGEALAKKTFNPQLGIVGGISILGTSGIVEPMSEAALIATIELETKQLLQQGQQDLIYVPGNYGEKYVEALFGRRVRTIQCSNFIGETIDLAAGYGASSLLLVGNFGKLVKLAGSIMNTHSRSADCRWEILVAHAALCGASQAGLLEMRQAITTDEMLTILQREGEAVYRAVLDDLLSEIDRHITKRAGKMKIGAILFSEKFGYLGETKHAAALCLRHEADRMR